MAKNENISDSLLYARHAFDGNRRNMQWLHVAYNAFCRLATYREMRNECKNYAYGRQYKNTMVYNGRKMTKEQYLEEKGIPALQVNILSPTKRRVQGQFRLNDTAPVCTAPDPNETEAAEVFSELLKKNMKLNNREELDARAFEEFLIGALVVYKITYGYDPDRGKKDIWCKFVNPNMVFFPDSLDFELRDIRFCGVLHDLDFSDVLAKFSHSDDDDARLRDIYNHCLDKEYIASQYSTDKRNQDIADTDFYYPREYGKCRVIELWTKERRKAWYCTDPQDPSPDGYFIPYNQKAAIERINQERRELNIKRWPDGTPMLDEDGNMQYFIEPNKYEKENLITYERKIETYWYYRYMSPDGYILEEGQSPYWNGSESFHPFVFKPYPYIDGEFHSYVSESKPVQDYFNYYLVALDFYIKNAAKGVLVIDEESLSDNMPIEDMADQWVRSNGVILYTSKKGGRAPDTRQAGSIPGGFDYILQLSRSLMEDVSGVHAAMQGKKAGESGVLYQSQITQASASILDLLRAFTSFLTQVAYKTIKVMKCFYTEKKQLSIAGKVVKVDLATMHDIELDVTISEDIDSPTYRALSNQFLLQGVQTGQIPFRVALETGSFPNSAKIINALDKYNAELQQIQAQQQAAMPAVMPQNP